MFCQPGAHPLGSSSCSTVAAQCALHVCRLQQQLQHNCFAGCASSVLTQQQMRSAMSHLACVVCCIAGVLSPQASLLAPASGPRTGAHSAAAGGAGAGPTRTPYPSAHYSSSLVGTPGSCAGGDGDEDGFVLFTSQSYVRQSQPAISPSFAAGLSAGPEEEPTTTPSQDSRVSEGGS